ncbi:MAG: hypothetical protein V4515_00095 [Chloroflexota bacterium]
MSSTAIGSASVVLSANADGLVSGLDKAERKTQGFGARIGAKLANSGIGRAILGTPEYDAASGKFLGKVGGLAGKLKGLLRGVGILPKLDTGALDKAEGKAKGFAGRLKSSIGGAGSVFGKLLGGAALGGVAGAAAGAVAGGIMKGFEVLGGIPDLIRGLAEKAQGPEAGPLKGIVKALDKVQAIAARVGGKLFAAIGPAFVAAGDVAESLADRFGPLVEKIGTGLGAAFSFGVEVGGELLTLVGGLIEDFGAWITEFMGLEDTAEGFGKVAMTVFRSVAVFAAYAWDTVKAGAGAIAWVAGKIATGLGHCIEAFRSVVDLAKSLPDALRPAWVDSFSDAVGNAGARVREVGDGISGWGANAVAGFGDSAAKVDQWMNGVEERFARRRDQLAAVVGMDKAKLGGAFTASSKEAYSIVTKFNTDAMVSAADPATRAAKAAEETNRLLREIARGFAGAQVLRTV